MRFNEHGNEAGPSNIQPLPGKPRTKIYINYRGAVASTSNFGGRAAASTSRSPDYARARTRSRKPGYSGSRSRSRSRDYVRSRSRSRSRDYVRSRSRSRSPDYYTDDDHLPLQPGLRQDEPPMLDDSEGSEDEPISANGDSWNSERAEPGGNVRTPISGTLTDPELLDCPICFLPLASPVYQCTNGHVLCESCCTKMSNTCGTCNLPIGKDKNNRCRAVEKILESFRIACKNAQHGCKRALTYIKKFDHEKTCRYVPCYCPVLDCTYVGLPKCVYTHFGQQHTGYHEQFFFNSLFSTSLEKDEKHIYLQEEGVSEIFVINRSTENFGSILNVICIAPTSSKKEFWYALTALDELSPSMITIKGIVGKSCQLTEQAPTTKYLIVPNYCLTSSGRLDLEITIRRIV